jgi:hypothetical protein
MGYIDTKAREDPSPNTARPAPPADTTSHPHRCSSNPSKARSSQSSGKTTAQQQQHSAGACEVPSWKEEPAARARVEREAQVRRLLPRSKPTESSTKALAMEDTCVTASVPVAESPRPKAGKGQGGPGHLLKLSTESNERVHPHASTDAYGVLFWASQTQAPAPTSVAHRLA